MPQTILPRNLKNVNVNGQKLCSAPCQIAACDHCNDLTSFEICPPGTEPCGRVIGFPSSYPEILHQHSGQSIWVKLVRNFRQHFRTES
jgi:hypothetical protein